MLMLSWLVVAVLLGLWSALVWTVHMVLSLLLGGASHLPAQEIRLPESWTSWLPLAVSEWMTETLEALQPWVQSVVGHMPALAGGVEVLAWVVWGVGTLLLVLAGAGAHVGVRVWQRSQANVPQKTLIAP